MHGRIEKRDRELEPAKGKKKATTTTDTVLAGDSDFFFWLQNAAGAAMNGMLGNHIEFPDGTRLALEPDVPARPQPRTRITPLRLQARSE